MKNRFESLFLGYSYIFLQLFATQEMSSLFFSWIADSKLEELHYKQEQRGEEKFY